MTDIDLDLLMTDVHGVATLTLQLSLGCDQQVDCPTHACGGTIDLMTNVPDLVWVAVVVPIGNLDHSSLTAVILMTPAVPNLCVSRKVFLKHQVVNWNTVCGAVVGKQATVSID